MPPRTTPSIGRHRFARMLSSHRGIGGSLLPSAVVFRSEREPAKVVCGRLSRMPFAGLEESQFERRPSPSIAENMSIKGRHRAHFIPIVGVGKRGEY